MNQWMALPEVFGWPGNNQAPAGEDQSVGPPEADARFDYARDRAITSYRNRYGRDPSEVDLRDSMPMYMTQEDRAEYLRRKPIKSPFTSREVPAPLGLSESDVPRGASLKDYAPFEDNGTRVRLDAARAATIQSYRNRLGRDPSLDELRSEMPNYLAPVDRTATEAVPIDDESYLAGFRPPSGPKQTKPPVNRPPMAVELAKSLLALAMKDPKGIPALLENPIVRAAMVPPVILNQMRENWLNSLGVDRTTLAAEDAELTDTEMRLGQVQDFVRGWDGRSFENYAKDRVDDGPCLFSEKDPTTGEVRCVYVGHTSGHDDSDENVRRRFRRRYPSNSYNKPVLHRTTRSYGASVGEEGRGINYYRMKNRSDNRYRAYSPWSPLARYYRYKALQEFGPFDPPIR